MKYINSLESAFNIADVNMYTVSKVYSKKKYLGIVTENGFLTIKIYFKSGGFLERTFPNMPDKAINSKLNEIKKEFMAKGINT